jgi:hypothetical protein
MLLKPAITRLISVLSLAGVFGAVFLVAQTLGEDATNAGKKWLSLLDDHKYEESWKQAGSMFRDEVKQDDWVAALERSRQPLGTPLSRAASRLDFTKSLRGAPDGDYAIIHFTTDFKNKTAVTERLTLVKEDGKWLAAAYAIH